MTDDEKKRRYKNIVYRLKVINNKISELNGDISGLEETTKKSIFIDDKPYNHEKMNRSQNNLTSAYNTIRGSIIPSLNRKIY